LDMGLADDYRAAVIAFDNVLSEFPDTKYAEEMEFLSIKAQCLYAEQSHPRRREERYGKALDLYTNFIADYPESKFRKEADGLKQDAERGIEEAEKYAAQVAAASAEAEAEEEATEPREDTTEPIS